jgi:hypothetical protein
MKVEEKHMIELSLNYRILSSYTAFVGIEKRVDENNIDMTFHEVTNQISADDQYLIVSHSFVRSTSINNISSWVILKSMINIQDLPMADYTNGISDSLIVTNIPHFISSFSSDITPDTYWTFL